VESDFKRYQFAPNILDNGVQQENLKLRQELGTIQERLELTERLYNGLMDQLRSKEKLNLILEKANVNLEKVAALAYEFVDRSQRETGQQGRNEIGESIAEHGISNRNPSSFIDPTPSTAQIGTNILHGQQSSGMRRLYTMS